MPGFLVFKELGLDFSDAVPGVVQGAIKAAIANLPGSWMLHGLGGENSVDVDPVAAMYKALEGDFPDSFWNAYKGWIPVVGVQQSFTSAAEAERRDIEGTLARQNEAVAKQAAAAAAAAARGEVDEALGEVVDQINQSSEMQLSTPDTKGTSSGGVFKTAMTNETSGVERISVEVQLDVSFPKLLKATLKPEGSLKSPKVFPSADIHLCTVASVDTRQLVMGSDSPAAQFIETLVSFFLFNIIPYVTISMKDVQVTEVSYNIPADAGGSPPTATVVLEYKEITWSYHVINGSNMNLFTVDFSYDVRQRKDPSSGLSLGSMLNPFA